MDNLIRSFEKKYKKQNIPDLKPGDTVMVWEKIEEKGKERIQLFEGVVIACKHGKDIGATFTVRKISNGRIGVEKTFPLHSPLVVKIELTKSSKTRRAKLNHLKGKGNIKSGLKKEQRSHKIWEDKKNEEELKRLEEEKAQQAKLKEEERKKEEDELEEKFKQRVENRQQKTDEKDENKSFRDGKKGGGDSNQVPGKAGNKNNSTES